MSNLNKETKTITLKQKFNSAGEEFLPERNLTNYNLVIAIGSTSNHC